MELTHIHLKSSKHVPQKKLSKATVINPPTESCHRTQLSLLGIVLNFFSASLGAFRCGSYCAHPCLWLLRAVCKLSTVPFLCSVISSACGTRHRNHSECSCFRGFASLGCTARTQPGSSAWRIALLFQSTCLDRSHLSACYLCCRSLTFLSGKCTGYGNDIIYAVDQRKLGWETSDLPRLQSNQ